MADYLATALVRVRPDTKGFTEDLRADLKKRISGIKLKVPIQAELKAFREQINREVRANPIKIPVIPDMTNFETTLRERVNVAAGKVSAKIKVEAVGGAGPSGGAAARADSAGAVATQQLTNAKRTLVSQEVALRGITRQRTAAVIEHNRALASGISLEEREKAVGQAVANIEAALTSTERSLVAARNAGNRALVTKLNAQAKLVASDKALIASTAALVASESASVALTDAEASAAHAHAAAMQVEVKTLKTLAETHALTNELKGANASITKALTVAEEQENAAAIARLATMRAELVAREALVAAQAAQIKAEAKAASSQAFVRRGALATALSFLKVRGATLAANQQFLLGAAAVAVFAKSVALAADLEQNLNVFKETAGATADEMERVGAAARQLGADVTLPSVSAGDAAEAMTGLAKAGLSVQESISGARGVLQLATAAQISNADATELAASALNSFGLSGGQAVHVADLLTGSANATQGSITDIGIALQQSSAVARQANLSLEDTVALLSLLAKNGIRGSDAGTSLRTAILRLIAPTKQAQKILDQLGITVQDVEGNFRPEVFDEFARANARFSDRQAATNARIVFGQDAIRAFSIAAREGVVGLDSMRAKTDDFGAAQRLAEARTTGLSGAVNGLVSNLETLGTNLGTFTLGPLTALSKGFTEATGDINFMVESILKLGGLVGKIKIPDIKLDVGPVHVESDSSTLGDKAGHAFGVAFSNSARTFIGSRFVPLPVAVGVIAARKFTSDTESIRANAEKTRAQVTELFKTFEQAPGPSSLGDLVTGLKALSSELASGDQQSRRFGEAIDAAIRKIQDAGQIPPPDLSNVFGPAGDRGAETFLDHLLKGLDDPARMTDGANIIANNLISALPPALESAFDRAQALIGGAIQAGVEKSIVQSFPQSAARISSRFEEALLNAQISGNRGRELELLRKKDADIQAQLDRGVADRKKRIALKDEQKQVQDDIASIENEIASDAKAAAGKVKDARDKADQAVIDSISLEEHRRQNAVARAALTKRLDDDVKANVALRNFYRRSLAEVRKTVKDATTRASEIVQLQGQLTAAEDAVDKAKKEQRDARKQRHQDALDKAEESRQLSIQIAQATGNKAKEERARKIEIAALERQIRATRAGSLQRKRLILALRQQQKELRDLQKERAKTTDEFKKLAFQFLTTQQGFAANLFGNLIGPASSGGLVGNTSTGPTGPTGTGGRQGAGGGPQKVLSQAAAPSPAQAVSEASDKADARGGGGITRGQAATLVHLMRRQLKILTDIHKDQGHPEARTRRVQQRTSTETGRD